MSNSSLTPGYIPAVPIVSADKYYIQPTLNHGLRIWWAFFWRNTLIAFGGGILLGIAIVVMQKYFSVVVPVNTVAFGGYIIEYIVAIFVIYFIARKKFHAFRIILTEQKDGSVDVLEPTFRRTFRIWWTYTWRSVIYRIALFVAMFVPLGFLTGVVQAISMPLASVFTVFAQVLASGAAGLFAIYSNILDEDIAGFRVGLAPRDSILLPSEMPNLGPLPGPAGPVAAK